LGTLCNNSSILAYCVIIVVKNKSKVLCAFCVYLVLILVVFKFNKQKNTLKTTLNKHQCLFRVVFGVIFRLLNLNGTRVQSNFDGRNSGFEFTATVENLHSKGLRSCSPALLIIQKYFRAGPAKKLFILVHRQYKSFYSDDIGHVKIRVSTGLSNKISIL